jgi:hypothetical protein
MATKITPGDLTVSITDNLPLNSVNYGSSTQYISASATQADQRVMSIDVKAAEGSATWTTVFSFAAAIAKGTGTIATFKYARFTNMDSTNFILLQLVGSTVTEQTTLKLGAGQTFILQGLDLIPNSGSSPTTYPTIGTIGSVQAAADTAAVDLEYVVVFG